ncbi:hypothetical protein J3R30DRAFT_1015 [Lentinula aciculospora]|uniref:Uncharacterized protein n=1 Tax=Lentinula aciculospora TaxID=153920 RepID=A0A9W9ATD5_9AGAR|nr:hypothetical protein J3R30DRAFT_1015 [Lentinula aciculospora]
MPLFGGHKHDKKHNTLHKDEQMGPGAAGGTNTSMAGSGTYAGDSNVPPAGGRTHHHQHQGIDSHQQGYHNQPIDNDYGNTGLNSQPGMGGMGNDGYNEYSGNQGNIPPSSHLNASGGRGHSTTGKVEKAIGTAVGSNALKSKGIQKEMEANALKTQSSELAEAERLEREAMLRRERAVAHGAHPENRHLGGGDGRNGM